MHYQFPVTKTTAPKAKPDPEHLNFGTVFTDHMFLMDYNIERAGTRVGSYLMGLFPLTPLPLYFIMPRKCSKD